MIKILLAEDNSVDALALSSYLKNNLGEFSMETVKSCLELIQLLDNQESMFDIIILDHILEDEQSLKYIDKIMFKRQKAEVIVLSGQSDISVCIQYLNAGVYAYLNKKNNSFKNLVKNINEIVSKKSGEVSYFKINKVTIYLAIAILTVLLGLIFYLKK